MHLAYFSQNEFIINQDDWVVILAVKDGYYFSRGGSHRIYMCVECVCEYIYIYIYIYIVDWKNPTRCEKINEKVDEPKHRQRIQINISFLFHRRLYLYIYIIL